MKIESAVYSHQNYAVEIDCQFIAIVALYLLVKDSIILAAYNNKYW